MRHVLIVSYFSVEEVERYLMLARVLATWPRPQEPELTCLLCTVVTGAEPDPRLHEAFSAIMPTRTYRCQTTIVGYPARPTAMFWEIMEHIAATDERDGGFALWFEADMVPARPSWLAELHAEWTSHPRPLVMGHLQPRSYVRSAHSLVSQHINGGACYAKSYGATVPAELKHGTFDLSPWRWLKKTGRYFSTELFKYSTLVGLERELQGRAAILHAYRQDKPAFYRRWMELMTSAEPRGDGGISAPCCDLRARHLGITYCPIHSEPTLSTRLANFVSVLAVTPWFSAKRRWNRLRQRETR